MECIKMARITRTVKGNKTPNSNINYKWKQKWKIMILLILLLMKQGQ